AGSSPERSLNLLRESTRAHATAGALLLSKMQPTDFTRIARILRKPPRLIVQRVLTELNAQTDRYRAPRRARHFESNGLLRATNAPTLDILWSRLAERLHAVPIRSLSPADYD